MLFNDTFRHTPHAYFIAGPWFFFLKYIWNFGSFLLLHLIWTEELCEYFWSTLKAYGASGVLRLQEFVLLFRWRRSKIVLFSQSQRKEGTNKKSPSCVVIHIFFKIPFLFRSVHKFVLSVLPAVFLPCVSFLYTVSCLTLFFFRKPLVVVQLTKALNSSKWESFRINSLKTVF